MKMLQILGTGCPKCRKLAETTEEAAKSLGLEYRMEKVTEIPKIMGFGVMMTPALAVDGVVKVRERSPLRRRSGRSSRFEQRDIRGRHHENEIAYYRSFLVFVVRRRRFLLVKEIRTSDGILPSG